MAYKTVPGKRNTQKVVHMILHLLALVAVALGLFVIVKFKNEVGEADFVSLHSWLGIITISLFGLQVKLDIYLQLVLAFPFAILGEFPPFVSDEKVDLMVENSRHVIIGVA